ncbi:MAG: Bug family tripartite tricarboxylate transporter substrate binding protein [Burkholderiales bacterium]
MTRLMRNLAALCLAVLTVAAVAQSTDASRPLRMVVPFPPGNASDLQARALAEHMRKAGRQVTVENRPGASGAIALEHVLRSPADGATLLVASLSPIVIAPAVSKSLPYDIARDFAGISALGYNDVVLLASPKFEAGSVRDLIAAARARPGAISYASIGQGTLAHMVMEQLAARTEVRMQHVPYKGSAQALPDLMSGEVAVMLDGMPQSLPQVEAGRLKALATLGRTRSQFAPSIPTVAESGIAGLQDLNIVGWTGVLASAATPRARVVELNAEIQKILAGAEMQAYLRSQRLQTYPAHSADDFARQIRAELEVWKEVARVAKVESN